MARAHRTYWRIRQKYRNAGLAGSIVGGVAAAVLIAPNVNGAEWASGGASILALQGALGFVLAVVLPPLVAKLGWRVHRRRFYEDIYRITAR